MKKSLIAAAAVILISAVSGVIYLAGNPNHKGNIQDRLKAGAEQGGQDENSDIKTINDITFGEFECSISGNDSVMVKYVKSGQTAKIFSLNPVKNEDSYDISQNGNSALYLSKDGHIWIIYSNGASKKITPDKYQGLNKNDMQKSNPGYIWADEPSFMPDGNIEFISNLPDEGTSPEKTIWKIDVDDGTMYPIYKPLSKDFRPLGYRSGDGKHIILDGDKIIVVDDTGSSCKTYETIDVEGKYIISLSPGGEKLIFANMDGTNSVDFGYIYMMDVYDKGIVKLPKVQSYKFTSMGAWNDEGDKYAIIIKPLSGSNDEIAVLHFDEAHINIDTYYTDGRFADSCKVRWAGDNAVSVDTGEDIVTISLDK